MASVTIITGDFDSGKTQTMIDLHLKQPSHTSDGFVSVKTYDDQGILLGYRLVCLTTRKGEMFIIDTTKDARSFERFFVYDRFVFSLPVIDTAYTLIRSWIEDPMIKTIFLDEVGMVECVDMGFGMILKELLKTEKNLVLAVNKSNLKMVLDCFGIIDPKMITIES